MLNILPACYRTLYGTNNVACYVLGRTAFDDHLVGFCCQKRADHRYWQYNTCNMILKKTCCMICMIMPRKRHMQPLCYNTTHARRARFIAFVTASLVASGALIQYIIGETSPLRHSSLRGTRPLSGTCAEYAASVQPTPGELTDLLGYQQKELPEVASNSPVLAASNWEGLANQQHAGNMRMLASSCSCNNYTSAAVIVSTSDINLAQK